MIPNCDVGSLGTLSLGNRSFMDRTGSREPPFMRLEQGVGFAKRVIKSTPRTRPAPISFHGLWTTQEWLSPAEHSLRAEKCSAKRQLPVTALERPPWRGFPLGPGPSPGLCLRIGVVVLGALSRGANQCLCPTSPPLGRNLQGVIALILTGRWNMPEHLGG